MIKDIEKMDDQIQDLKELAIGLWQENLEDHVEERRLRIERMNLERKKIELLKNDIEEIENARI